MHVYLCAGNDEIGTDGGCQSTGSIMHVMDDAFHGVRFTYNSHRSFGSVRGSPLAHVRRRAPLRYAQTQRKTEDTKKDRRAQRPPCAGLHAQTESAPLRPGAAPLPPPPLYAPHSAYVNFSLYVAFCVRSQSGAFGAQATSRASHDCTLALDRIE